MEIHFSGESLNTQAVSAMIGFMAQRANVCAKVLNRSGEVVAVNRRGLDLIQRDPEAVCGQVWETFWSETARNDARRILDAAFEGRRDSFVGAFDGTDPVTWWRAESMPLDDGDAGVQHVLILCTDVSAAGDVCAQDDTNSAAGEVLHKLSNMVSVSSSSARILARAGQDERLSQLASELERTAAMASDALDQLRDLLGLGNAQA